MSDVAAYEDFEEMVDRAEALARFYHAGQTRKDGTPYIEHPRAIVDLLKMVDPDIVYKPVILAAAWLHDTLEDTGITPQQIIDNTSPRTLAIVKQVTNDPVKLRAMGKGDYIAQKVREIDDDALLIKLGDRYHNVSDLQTADVDWALRYAGQTQLMLDALDDRPALPRSHRLLIEMIEEEVDEFLQRVEETGT